MTDKKNFKLNPMSVVKLKAVRESDFGIFLDAGTGSTSDDILLHKNQQTSEIKVGDVVEVFLYLNPQKKLTASMKVPKMRVGQISRLKVINKSAEGIFLDVGAERGIFMPFAEMVGRPAVGDTVWAKLYIDKSGRLATSMKVSDEIRRASQPAKNLHRGDRVKGSIYNITESGAFMFTEDKNIVFIAQKEIPRVLKCGENVEARVTFVREDGRLNASLIQQKEFAQHTDARKILKFMRENKDINLSDKTDPKKIYALFHISKAAFKRAIGHLLKKNLITKTDTGFKVIDG